MVLRGPTTNITGVILVIDVIKVANEFFSMADLKVMGFRTTGKTIDIAMLFQDLKKKLYFPEKYLIRGLNKGQ